MMRSNRFALGAMAALGMVLVSSPAFAVDWGTIEGQVVWGGKEVPKAAKIDSSKEPKCAAKGDLHSQAYVINPKNKGVRWCLVWLVDAEKWDKAIPINRRLKTVKPKDKQVVVDQPHCMFEPHVMGLYKPEQSLLIKNSADFPHNVHLNYGRYDINKILPPGGEYEVPSAELELRAIPMSVSCDIHGWMKGYVGVFANPYFAVTDKDGKFKIADAPAGKYKLVIWQETTGWVLGGGSPAKGGGKEIEIKPDTTTDLGKFECKPSED